MYFSNQSEGFFKRLSQSIELSQNYEYAIACTKNCKEFSLRAIKHDLMEYVFQDFF